MNVKIQIEGIEKLKSYIKKGMDISSYLPDITSAISLFHNQLDQRVAELYNVENVGSLDTVFLGRSVKPEALGKTFVRYGLQYNDVAVKLSKYPFELTEVYPTNAIPYERNGKVSHRPINKARRVTVNIRKNGKAPKRVRTKFPKFYAASLDGIFARDQEATWEVFPESPSGIGGKRAKYTELYGPSLAKLAEITFQYDDVTQVKAEEIPNSIIKAMTKYYENI